MIFETQCFIQWWVSLSKIKTVSHVTFVCISKYFLCKTDTQWTSNIRISYKAISRSYRLRHPVRANPAFLYTVVLIISLTSFSCIVRVPSGIGILKLFRYCLYVCDNLERCILVRRRVSPGSKLCVIEMGWGRFIFLSNISCLIFNSIFNINCPTTNSSYNLTREIICQRPYFIQVNDLTFSIVRLITVLNLIKLKKVTGPEPNRNRTEPF